MTRLSTEKLYRYKYQVTRYLEEIENARDVRGEVYNSIIVVLTKQSHSTDDPLHFANHIPRLNVEKLKKQSCCTEGQWFQHQLGQ